MRSSKVVRGMFTPESAEGGGADDDLRDEDGGSRFQHRRAVGENVVRSITLLQSQ